jgi:hypothetical protein
MRVVKEFFEFCGTGSSCTVLTSPLNDIQTQHNPVHILLYLLL